MTNTASETTACTETSTNGSRPLWWRSLDQLEGSPEFQSLLQREFPDGVSEAPDDVSRRGFLQVVAASVALAGLTSCRKPVTLIKPFNTRPEGFKPGVPQFYATTFTRSGYGLGVLVKSSDGRPTKIEGNPLHPGSRGGTDQFVQAELLGLYDPGRSTEPRGPHSETHAASDHGAAKDHGKAAEHGKQEGQDGHEQAPKQKPIAEPAVYADFRRTWDAAKKELMPQKGKGLRVLLAPSTSPTLLGMVEELRATCPDAKVHFWEPLHRDAEIAGSQAAFGKALETHVDYAKAEVVLSLDCDFLGLDGQNVVNSKAWATRRRAPVPGQQLSRLYAVEAGYSLTGSVADHRFRVRAQEIPAVAFGLAAALGTGQGNDLGTAVTAHKEHGFTKGGKDWISIVAKDLRERAGRCAVVAGPRMPAAVHAAVHAINLALGNVGKTISYTELPASLAQSCVESVRELARDIQAGNVKVLICLGTNPVHDAPADLKFSELLDEKKVATRIHVGLYRDETAQRCNWHFNMAHDLESWGDARAADGSVSLRQPLIAPLYGGISAAEFLALICESAVTEQTRIWFERNGAAGYELCRKQWRDAGLSPDFESWWQKTLHDGVALGSASPPVPATNLNAAAVAALVKAWSKPTPGSVNNLEIVLRADSKVLDGRYANNSWMQELPDPLTKLTWDNAALMSIKTAAELGVENGEMLELGAEGGATKLQAPAWILPGHADWSITLTLGYGRELAAECKVAKGAGVDAYKLRNGDRQHLVTGVRANKAGSRYALAVTQDHGTMAGRAVVRESTQKGYEATPDWAPRMSPLDQQARTHGKTEQDEVRSLWKERIYGPDSPDPVVAASPYQWGMVIDLNACTGCSACVVACAAENNIPMVGKIQVARGREMFWIRSDRYFGTSDAHGMEAAEDPVVSHMPVPCMQCENAPCESVCPVAATTHSPDGLNDMAYNRCIGTRYCNNNCPYKVRRFNYLDFIGNAPPTKQMSFNPDVTVRNRGVMEKCTYCVQRINGARIHAKIEKRTVRDGEITPACAQVCPTEAITFGNLLDKDSRVSKLKNSPLNYSLLSEFNTKPRTTYLGRVRNPNLELA